MDRHEILGKLYLAELAKLNAKLDKYPRIKYAMGHHHNIRGEPMRFHDMKYLIDIYCDDAQEIIMQSSVQTGKSEFLIISAFYYAEMGLQCMYVLPTTELRNSFVANRVDKLFETIPHYGEMLRHGANVAASRGLKHFGKGTIFYLGSNSATTFIEKPIDAIFADETDRFDLINYEKADDRMTASPYKLKYEASNPTVDNFGINKRYRVSNMCQYNVKCEHCNEWQPLDWFINVVRQTDDGYALLDREWDFGVDRDILVFCRKCHKPVSRYGSHGQWVAEFPNRKKTHGYLIHQLLSKFVSVEQMWIKFMAGMDDDTTLQVFYNSMLGQTFAGKGSKLTDDILNACKQDYLMPVDSKLPCIMGVDVGKKLHIIIREIIEGGLFRLVFAGTVREFEDLDSLFCRFNIVGYVIDAMPETRKAAEYAKKYPGRGWICRYVNGLKEIATNEEERVVSVDRTMAMDKVQKNFEHRRNLIPRNAQSLDTGDFYAQMKTPTRIYDLEKNRYDWLGDPDHYYHAEVYSMVAHQVRGEFKVYAINPNKTEFAKPVEFDDLPLPPNTPPEIREHYQRLYAQSGHLINN